MLRLAPCDLDEANEFVARHHRHHPPVVGHKFSLSALNTERIVGVVIVGRPVSRMRDDGTTLEVTRLCTVDMFPGTGAVGVAWEEYTGERPQRELALCGERPAQATRAENAQVATGDPALTEKE